jgi:hypothetical protein
MSRDMATVIDRLDQHGSDSYQKAFFRDGRDATLDNLAATGLSTTAIVDVLTGVRENFGPSGGDQNSGGSKGSGAGNDLFASPAYAAGRAYCASTMDSLLCETYFQPFLPSLVKLLVRSARKGQLILLPVTEVILMMQDKVSQREEYLSSLANQLFQEAAGETPTFPHPCHVTYGQVVEHFLRVWNLSPIGIYRRQHPAAGLKAGASTAATLRLAAGPPQVNVETPFAHNRALLSFVFTNPPVDTFLGEHDMIYFLREGVEEEDIADYGDIIYGDARVENNAGRGTGV